jgi:hypothetical protein
MDKIILQKVYYMPKQLDSGILYVSEEFKVAAHLCPCGCGNKIVTPITPVNWSFNDNNNKPTLSPSISNWQLPCKSHYWITKGYISWSYKLSKEEASESWLEEEKSRMAFYENHQYPVKNLSVFKRIKEWVECEFRIIFSKNKKNRQKFKM